MEGLAKWIGLSRKTIYNHFSGKTELIAEAVETGMARVIHALSKIADDNSLDFVDRLNKIVEHGFYETKRLWDPMSGHSQPRSPMQIRSSARELNRHIGELIQGIVTEAAEKGLLASGIEPGVFARVIINMITGIRSIDYFETLPCSPLELLRESLRISLVGALSPHGETSLRDSRILSSPGARGDAYEK
jgi:TetR/AcrR family transcriptional regulator, cholesterol catabolism regulator